MALDYQNREKTSSKGVGLITNVGTTASISVFQGIVDWEACAWASMDTTLPVTEILIGDEMLVSTNTNDNHEWRLRINERTIWWHLANLASEEKLMLSPLPFSLLVFLFMTQGGWGKVRKRTEQVSAR
jgi:hypothetical protein